MDHYPASGVLWVEEQRLQEVPVCVQRDAVLLGDEPRVVYDVLVLFLCEGWAQPETLQKGVYVIILFTIHHRFSI